MKALNSTTAPKVIRPEKIIQFGEGNFLRAFVDWIVWCMNRETDFNGQVVVVQPIARGMVSLLNQQDGLYHLILKGLDKGKPVYSIQLIDSISRGINPYTAFGDFIDLATQPEIRFVISNTTEAGIAFNPDDKVDDQPASSYPGKLVQLLWHRFVTFSGAADKGLLIFPCELIFHNGDVLTDCIEKYITLWNLGDAFRCWFQLYCGVYSTLVDRIVPGYPHDTADEIRAKTGYNDQLIDEGEIFHLWVIEAPESVANEFPAHKAGLNVLFVPSEKPYHERKVTLLNGPHTVLSPVGYLSGLDTVRECMEHPVVGPFIRKVMLEELLPTLDLPEAELKQFAADVSDRFLNPYVKHNVTGIMLNSFPKFKTRDLPGLKLFLSRKGVLPSGIVLGLAAIITYYKGGKRGETEIVPQDDNAIVTLLTSLWASNDMNVIARGVLSATFIWEEDLNAIPGLTRALTKRLEDINRNGMVETVKTIL